MHLSKILINGFKSFADSIELDIDQGITGVVGPNGSGKSNIIDSVRWVMGEQNAKTLRGEKGTDIIFAGSQSRKQLGMAEVSLVFNNEDESAFCPPEFQHESELTLTRRIYQDGQRDYLINRKPCRLKDIVNFFAATGLGGRSYSMIQQGQVDRILNSKPEGVREILEEAAGTTVFKKKKHEAERRLNLTNENLERIDDILRELIRQKRTLKKQAEKAKEHKTQLEELRHLETTLFAMNFQLFNTKKIDITDSLSSFDEKQALYAEELTQLDSQLSEVQEQLDEADPEVHALQEQITITREHIIRSENIIANAEHLRATGGGRQQELQKLIEEESKNLQEFQLQLDSSQEEVDSAKTEADAFQIKLDKVNEELERFENSKASYSTELENFEDEIKNLERLIAGTELKMENNKEQQETLQYDKKTNQQRLRDLEQEYGELLIMLDAAQVKVSSEKNGLDTELSKKQTLVESIHVNDERLLEIAEKRDIKKQTYIELKTKIASTKEIQLESCDIFGLWDQLDSSMRSNCALLGNEAELNEEGQQLSDNCKRAIGHWLESFYCVDGGEVQLIQAARQLSAQNFRIFRDVSIDKDEVTSWASKYDLEAVSGFLKIESNKPGSIFERAFVSHDLQIDEGMVASMPKGIALIASNGCLYTDPSHYTVLSNDVESSVEKHQRLEEMEKNLETVQAELASIQLSFDDIKSINEENRSSIVSIDDFLQSQNKGVIDVMTEFEAVRQQEEHKRGFMESAKEGISHSIATENALLDAVDQLKEDKKNLQKELAEVQKAMDGYQSDKGDFHSERDKIIAKRSEIQVEFATKQSRSQVLLESFSQTKMQFDRIEQSMQRRYREQENIRVESEESGKAEKQAKVDLQQLITERERLEKDYTEKRAENSGLIERQRMLDGDIKDKRDEIAEIQQKASSRRIELERLEVGIENIRVNCLEKYEMQVEDLPEVDPKAHKADELNARVVKLRKKAENVGPINMMAIEQYDAICVREEFILKQRDEVLRTITLIHEAISEIEQTSKNKFLVIYHTINQEFGNLFPVLFPTGEARLELTDPDDPLNGGVEILCRLPGKKLQRLNLFSGGEKALTAISLIFALLKTKPTPFCFLDEVDAPLDEANVVRYNKVLAMLSQRFQFIVITHNRRTMEVLDTLYGITMQEPGVSKVVGVDMSRDIPDHLKNAFKPGPRRAQGATATAPLS